MRSTTTSSFSFARNRGVRRNRSEELRLSEQRKARCVPRVFFLMGLGILIRFVLVTPSASVGTMMMMAGLDVVQVPPPTIPAEYTTTKRPPPIDNDNNEVGGKEVKDKNNSGRDRENEVVHYGDDVTTITTSAALAKDSSNTTAMSSSTIATTATTTDPKKGTTTNSSSSCPHIHLKQSTKVYKEQFLKDFPVQVPKTTTTTIIISTDDKNANEGDSLDTIPCSNIPDTCDLTNTTFGHPFLMISFGRSGTTSTWDILAGLTGDYIPRATEDMGRDKKESIAFFQARNQTEHGKCWLERLLCQKQATNRKAYQNGYGLASVYGSKWKPWHLGLNTTQARQALEWLGTQKQIKVVYNTRNMIDMFISMRKHTFLQHLFGNERTAHCYDDRELQLSHEAWDKLAAMGIPRDTPCVQIFKQIEQRTYLQIPWMMDYFERNALQTDFAAQMLDYYNVSHVRVTYEKLYFRQTADEWLRIFRYLGFGPQNKNLTLEEVFAKTTFQKTSSHDRSKRMANYDEVSRALRCTRYAEYLD